MALGATTWRIRRRVLVTGMATVGAGFVVGYATSVLAARVVRGVLVGVTAFDPLTLAIVGSSLAAVAFIALYLPARWATGGEPLAALRND